MISICCAIVLYKMQLSESPAFQSAYAQIGTHHKIRLFIFDNSPDADSNHRNYPDIRYDHCPDNKGLGYAYNAARKNWTGCCFWIKIRFYRMVFSIVTSMQFLLIRICNFSFHRSFSRKVRSFLLSDAGKHRKIRCPPAEFIR